MSASTAFSGRLLPFAGIVGFALLGTTLAGCGSSDGGDAGSAAQEVEVTATDSACTADTTTVPAGRTTFDVTNKGSKVTELYVYAQRDGKFTAIKGEVEDIGPGTSRDLTVSLDAGSYELACKPGETGDGIRQPITVTD